MKLLFVVKNREFPYTEVAPGSPCQPFSSGLFNSVSFVVEMLQDLHYDTVLETAVDGNCIDKFIHRHRPTHIVLEALWATPSKIYELQLLHPSIKWIVRLHSEIPFISNEGIAIEWLRSYQSIDVDIVVNSPRMMHDLNMILDEDVDSAPNYYPLYYQVKSRAKFPRNDHYIHVGCFGAIRPLKNHLTQAIAAMKYADSRGKAIAFHINGTRVEGGNSILKNLHALFKNNRKGHILIDHPWYDHAQFREVVSTMDIVLQVSFSETYNIVAADAVSQLVPVVGSDEITFISKWFQAKPTSVRDIAAKMCWALRYKTIGTKFNQYLLKCDSNHTKNQWNWWAFQMNKSYETHQPYPRTNHLYA